MEALGEKVVGWVVKCKRVEFAIGFSRPEVSFKGEEVCYYVENALKMLGEEAMMVGDEECGNLPSHKHASFVVDGVGFVLEFEEPADSRGVVSQTEEALVFKASLIAFQNHEPDGNGHG